MTDTTQPGHLGRLVAVAGPDPAGDGDLGHGPGLSPTGAGPWRRHRVARQGVQNAVCWASPGTDNDGIDAHRPCASSESTVTSPSDGGGDAGVNVVGLPATVTVRVVR